MQLSITQTPSSQLNWKWQWKPSRPLGCFWYKCSLAASSQNQFHHSEIAETVAQIRNCLKKGCHSLLSGLSRFWLGFGHDCEMWSPLWTLVKLPNLLWIVKSVTITVQFFFLKGSIFVSKLLYIAFYKHENRQVWWHHFQDHDVFVDLPVDGHCCGEIPCCVSTSPLQDGRHC